MAKVEPAPLQSLNPAVLGLLRRAGLAAPDEAPRATPLAGGVSSDIWRIDLARGPLCVKQALAKLRVAELWEAPVERNRYERLWMETAARAAPGVTPQILAHDDAAGFFVMEYLENHPVWKAELREGRADPAFAAKVGTTLARIHAATARRDDLARLFHTDDIFYAIRLEPYLAFTAQKHPDLASVLIGLVERTARTKMTLVHGDVSPKNILLGPKGPVFLDAECAWYGDPAFDLAFCLNHLLLKCLWVPAAREAFISCFDALARGYLSGISWENPISFESRAASLLPGLLLARVDGKSPVEYLTGESQRALVRHTARLLLIKPPSTLSSLRDAWQRSSM